MILSSVMLWSALLFCVIAADVSDQNLSIGTHLCVRANDVEIRHDACGGTVIGSANSGQCYTYRGHKVGCTLSGKFNQFFEVDVGDVSGWIAGDFLYVGNYGQSEPEYSAVAAAEEPTTEFRALFIATVANIDWPISSSDSTSSQQQQLRDYVNMMEATNMNAIIFQVRPVGDAMYSSNIEPWSKYLTGTQGLAPNPLWDPLSFLVTEAHSRGIEVHAWLNPYRANTSPTCSGLAANHMATVYPEYAYVYSDYCWMDPGVSVIVDRLVSVIEDVIARYDVDGIHFDDYFYPYPDEDGTHFPDNDTYSAYLNGGGSLSLADWRRDNVNRMIERVRDAVHTKAGVKFSVSPFGIHRAGDPEGVPSPIVGFDPYTQIYADSKLWLQNGWVDFMAPQLYWEIDPPEQSYPTLLDWWLDENTANVHIYAANGVYKMFDDNDWPVSEIENQIAISRDSTRREKLSLGNIMFSAKYFRDNLKNITDVFQARVYTKPATVPTSSSCSLPARSFLALGMCLGAFRRLTRLMLY